MPTNYGRTYLLRYGVSRDDKTIQISIDAFTLREEEDFIFRNLLGKLDEDYNPIKADRLGREFG